VPCRKNRRDAEDQRCKMKGSPYGGEGRERVEKEGGDVVAFSGEIAPSCRKGKGRIMSGKKRLVADNLRREKWPRPSGKSDRGVISFKLRDADGSTSRNWEGKRVIELDLDIEMRKKGLLPVTKRGKGQNKTRDARAEKRVDYFRRSGPEDTAFKRKKFNSFLRETKESKCRKRKKGSKFFTPGGKKAVQLKPLHLFAGGRKKRLTSFCVE